MANKKTSVKKPKQNKQKDAGQKGGAFNDVGSPAPVRKPKKKK